MTTTPSLSADAPARAAAQLFLNRDLSWLEFNHRVLHEAQDARTPLLDRAATPRTPAANSWDRSGGRRPWSMRAAELGNVLRW